MHLSVVTFVSIITAFVLSATRILSASKWAWNYLPTLLQGLLPGLVVALPALAQALVGAQSWTDVTVAFLVAGALVVPGLHSHTVAVVKPNGPGSTVAGAAALALLCGLTFAATGCSLFESKAPELEKCAPTPAALATQVAEILEAGSGDYASELEQLALTDGENAIVCAVGAFFSDLKTVDAAPGRVDAKARAHAYLKSKGVQ